MSASSTASATMSAWVSRTTRTPERTDPCIFARSSRVAAWSSSCSDSSTEQAAHAGQHLVQRRRAAARVEEVVVDAHLLHAQQHLTPHVARSPRRGPPRRTPSSSLAPPPVPGAPRSTLPLGVSGRTQPHEDTGTMYSGSRVFRWLRRSAGSGPAPLRRLVRDRLLLRAQVFAHDDTASRHARVLHEHAQSHSSMRKPRSLTWCPSGPGRSGRRPTARNARSPVLYMRAPSSVRRETARIARP